MLWIKNSAIVLLLLIASFANAAQALTDKQIQQWLNSIDAIQQWAEKQEGLDDKMPENTNEMFSAEAMVAQLKSAGLYNDAENIIQDNGFDSPEQWANIQMKIIKAMISLEMDKENVNASEIQAQLDKIKNNPSISAEQKEMMINMMQSSMGMMEQMSNAPEADKIALKPFLPQIKKKLNAE
jgi:hypothetical protein